MENKEHKLQSACVKWFRLQYPKYSNVLFAIPNGAKRNPRSGRWYKEEGMLAGAPDMVLLAPDAKNTLHGVGIEFKSTTGVQSEPQKEIQIAMHNQGYAYWLIRNFDTFKNAIENYLE